MCPLPDGSWKAGQAPGGAQVTGPLLSSGLCLAVLPPAGAAVSGGGRLAAVPENQAVAEGPGERLDQESRLLSGTRASSSSRCCALSSQQPDGWGRGPRAAGRGSGSLGPGLPCSPARSGGRRSSRPPDLQSGEDACWTLARCWGCRVAPPGWVFPPPPTPPRGRPHRARLVIWASLS